MKALTIRQPYADVQQHHVGKPDPVLVLVGCTKSKLTVPAPAAELYSPSALFVARRRYAEATKYPWAVLSALHGIVHPEAVLEPYDFTVEDLIRPGSRVDPWAWSTGVIRDAMRQVGYDNRVILEVHAGIAYVRLLRQAADAYHDWSVEILHPVEGLGIGEQKAWYAGVRPLGLEDRFKPATCACDGEFAGCERCQYLDRREVALQAVADAIADEDAAAEAVAREVWADGFEGDEFRPTLADFLAAQS